MDLVVGMATSFKTDISAIVLGVSRVLIGIEVDYGIHLLFRTDQFERKQVSQNGSIFIGIGLL